MPVSVKDSKTYLGNWFTEKGFDIAKYLSRHKEFPDDLFLQCDDEKDRWPEFKEQLNRVAQDAGISRTIQNCAARILSNNNITLLGMKYWTWEDLSRGMLSEYYNIAVNIRKHLIENMNNRRELYTEVLKTSHNDNFEKKLNDSMKDFVNEWKENQEKVFLKGW